MEAIAKVTEHPRSHPYPGGFILSKALQLDAPSTYTEFELPGYFRFWRDTVAEIQTYVHGNEFVIVHGLALYLGESKEPLPEVLYRRLKAGLKEFIDEIGLIGGRYAIISHIKNSTMIVQDPFGARSVYYSVANQIASSHANLINDLIHHDHNSDLDCDPSFAWDLSPYVGVLALLPNTLLRFEESIVTRFFPHAQNRFLDWTAEEKLARIEELWIKQLELIRDRGQRIAFSATGGSDSRVLLAMARNFVADLDLFTYTAKPGESEWNRSLALDETITTQIVDDLQIRHQFLRRPPLTRYSENLSSVMEKNSFQHHGRWILPLYRELFPAGDVLHMRGNLLEVARAYWINPAVPDSFEAALRMAQRYSRSSNRRVLRSIEKNMRDSGYSESMYDFDRRDLLVWEMRYGRWLAELLNETDAAFETFMPANVRDIMELLLAFPEADRQSNKAAWELVNRNWPVLNFYGRNDRRNLYEQAREADAMQHFSGGPPARVNGDVVGPLDSYVVNDPSGQALSNGTLHEGMARICADQFLAGNSLTVSLANVDQRSDVQFSFHNKYSAVAGAGVFHFEVRVDGKMVLFEEGSGWGRTSSVSLSGVPESSAITFHIVVDRSNPRLSWESASATSISEVRRFLSRSNAGLKVGSSNPYAQVIGKEIEIV